MVQSSIVIPTNNSHSSSKRKVEEEDLKNAPDERNEEEQAKRPRLEVNEAGKRRNKRLFGVLLGTLNKFKDDTEQSSEIDKKRREINKKLQDKLDLEKKAVVEKIEARKLEKERVEQDKKEQEEKIMNEKREHFQAQQKRIFANFLKTTTRPSLYYLPDKLTEEMSSTIEKQVQEAQTIKKSFEGRRVETEDRLSDNED